MSIVKTFRHIQSLRLNRSCIRTFFGIFAEAGDSSKPCQLPDTPLVEFTEVHRFVKDAFAAIGSSDETALAMADALTEADYRGHYAYGLRSLEHYINEIASKAIDPCATPTVVKQNGVTALVNGKNALGVIIGNCCMNLACDKAECEGIGCVAAYGATNFGMAGYYTMLAIERSMIGMCFSNTVPVLVPPGAKEGLLGCNSFSMGAPAREDSFNLDMAFSCLSPGKVQPLQLPNGIGVDENGNATNAADKVCYLLPIGGYKGFGLAMAVELLTGILSGGNFAKCVPIRPSESKPSNLGQLYIAINPDFFGKGFSNRLAGTLCMLRRKHPAVIGQNLVSINSPRTKNHVVHIDMSCRGKGTAPFGDAFSQKGFDFALMIEILTSILAGARSSTSDSAKSCAGEPANLGHCYMAINPENFSGKMNKRISTLFTMLKEIELVDPCKPVMVMGETEKKHMKLMDTKGGIRYPKNVWEKLDTFSKQLKICPLEPWKPSCD